jgi:L-2-hydroxyglutarate oxidase LhgO
VTYDFIIAGAGVIGLTIAREILLRQPNSKLLILEKETVLGVHASGRNSGILHTGIYYPAETLKAKFCKKGADTLFNYAAEHNIPARKDGKVVVASSEHNAKGLTKLMDNARENGISAELLDEAQIKEIEPHAFAKFGGIYCKDTAVIDSNEVLAKLQAEIIRLGGEFKFSHAIKAIDKQAKQVVSAQGKFGYKYLVNATGSFADNVAKMVGMGEDYKLIPFKGLYYKLNPDQAYRVKGSIYPVPDPDLPFLGVHFTRVISGDVYVGPTAIPALGRENYGLLQGLNVLEASSILAQLARLYGANVQNFRNLVHKELPHLTKSGFLKSACALVDELQPQWLQSTAKVGIRPQLINLKKKQLEMDFLIEKDESSLHVLNSISPAFTSSFAVAEHIVDEINL